MKKPGRKRGKSSASKPTPEPKLAWQDVAMNVTSALDCVTLGLELDKDGPDHTLLGIYTAFGITEREVKPLGVFELGLTRLNITLEPKKFKARPSGFLTAYRPARIVKYEKVTGNETGKAAVGVKLAPEINFGAKGLAAKAGELTIQSGGGKRHGQKTETIELNTAHVRPTAGGAIALSYRERRARAALDGQFDEIVRGKAEGGEVTFVISARARDEDYFVGRRVAGRPMPDGRIPFVRFLAMLKLQHDKTLIGSYAAEASCGYGKAKTK